MSEKKIDIKKDSLFTLPSASTESASASTKASFKIKTGKKKATRTTVTYRLNTETVEKIDELAFRTRNSINETVQQLLDLALDNVE